MQADGQLAGASHHRSPDPYFHQTVVARTPDGLTLTGARQVIDHASVPDGVRRADASVLVYYVNGAAEATWVARLVADTAQVIGPITVDGVARPVGVVDPDVQLLASGDIRMIYLNGFGAPTGVPRALCGADSQDGVRFTTRDPRSSGRAASRSRIRASCASRTGAG